MKEKDLETILSELIANIHTGYKNWDEFEQALVRLKIDKKYFKLANKLFKKNKETR